MAPPHSHTAAVAASPQVQALGAPSPQNNNYSSSSSSSSSSPSASSSTSSSTPTSSTSSVARDRLLSLSLHIMGSYSPSVFTSSVVPKAPEDPLFGLVKSFRQDKSDKKVDVVIGAYRDDNSRPWILPVVKKV